MGLDTVVNDTVEGAFPNQEIEQVLEPWFGLKKENVSIESGSFDYPISDKCYRISTFEGFKIPEGVTVEDIIKELPDGDKKIYDLSSEKVTAPGSQYIVHLGKVRLPKNFFIRSSPKSTMGRLGTYIRFMADHIPNFEQVEGPYEGNLWALYETHAFHIGIQAGDFLNQLRIFCKSSFKVEGRDLMQEYYNNNMLYLDEKPVDVSNVDLSEGVPISLDLRGPNEDSIVGFIAKNNPEPISLRARDIDYNQYFNSIRRPENGKTNLGERGFGIFSSREGVRVPGHLAMEMTQYHRKSGAARLHKAGFFDPYFGFGESGQILGANGVLEIDSHEKQVDPLVHGQSAGMLEVQRLRKTASVVYGTKNNYQGQHGPRLAKQFREVK